MEKRAQPLPGRGEAEPAGRARQRYSERRKFSRACLSPSSSRLYLSITALASDGPNLELPPLLCAWIASWRSSVRPSWRKKTRLPSPHSGAVRNSSPLARPWRISSASPGPMAWIARSENRFAALSDRAAMVVLPGVLRVGVWQSAHPTSLKRVLPLLTEKLLAPLKLDTGVGGASKRWKLAKLSMALIVCTFSTASLGTVANWQFAFS